MFRMDSFLLSRQALFLGALVLGTTHCGPSRRGPDTPETTGAAARSQAVTAPPFTATGALAVGHSLHTQTLLADGRVLVAGGQRTPFTDVARDVGNVAEIYDPQAGTFTRTGNLQSARALHTATLLADGQVLVAGGEQSGNGSLASAELYDPVAGTFSLTSPMRSPRQAHTATLLSNGRVLITGGFDGAVTRQLLASAELYDPATRTFFPVGNMNFRRQLHQATVLQDGRVLITGGYGGPPGSPNAAPVREVEIYEPATGQFTVLTTLNTARFLHQATLLRSGQVLVTGGANFASVAAAEIFDPATDSFYDIGNMLTARQSHTTTLLANGWVLIAGGSPAFQSLVASSTAELFDPGSGQFFDAGTLVHGRERHGATLLAGGQVLLAGGHAADNVLEAELYTVPNPLPTPGGGGGSPQLVPQRFAHSAHSETTLLDGRVLVVGGNTKPFTDFARDASRNAEIFDPATRSFSYTGSLQAARVLHTATRLDDGRVLIAGGEQNGTDSLATAEIYSTATGRFTYTRPMGDRRQAHTATRLGNGQVLVVGGYDGVTRTALASTELYDPALDLFTRGRPLSVGRQLHSATLLQDGRVLIAGGMSNAGPTVRAEIYDPSTGQFVTTGDLQRARFLHQATLLADGRVLITGGAGSSVNFDSLAEVEIYDPATREFTIVGSLNQPRQGHTATLVETGLVLIAGGSPGYQSTVATDSIELFIPTTERLLVAGFLADARERHTATRLASGEVLLVGGHNQSTLREAELAVYINCDDGIGCTTDAAERGVSALVCRHMVERAGVLCRRATGGCDVPESCDGASINCPPDRQKPSSTLCRPSIGACDVAEYCTGTSPDCPSDARMAAGTVCRPATGGCDVEEQCNGTGGTCPPDRLQPAGAACRPAAGFCDVAETCSGTSAECPTDGYKPDGTQCGCSNQAVCFGGVCSAEQNCDDGNPCTVDSCEPGVGCRHEAIPDGSSCADDTVCNGDEICRGGICYAGLTLVCDDLNARTADRCDAKLGCLHVRQGCSCQLGGRSQGDGAAALLASLSLLAALVLRVRRRGRFGSR
ncbi:MAG TPA: kelch repeat-containing protein [Polyangia bacterium]|nr:kelch repeat-containing protein [Polyangia bacterium]